MYDPVAFGFQQVGYISAGEANQAEDYERMVRSQNAVGYPSAVFHGKDAKAFLKSLWPDFDTDRIAVALPEKMSGYAGPRPAVRGLACKCEAQGVRVLSGGDVTGYARTNGVASKVRHPAGDIACTPVVLGL